MGILEDSDFLVSSNVNRLQNARADPCPTPQRRRHPPCEIFWGMQEQQLKREIGGGILMGIICKLGTNLSLPVPRACPHTQFPMFIDLS
jgi:hypothetical protein